MIGWGILASLTGLIHTSAEFNIIRFLLGVAEGARGSPNKNRVWRGDDELSFPIFRRPALPRFADYASERLKAVDRPYVNAV